MASQSKQHWYDNWYIWLIPWAMIISLLYLSIQLSPIPIPLRDFTLEEVTQLLTSLTMIALFLERALEVFITTWRGPGSTDKENSIGNAQKDVEEIKSGLTAELSRDERDKKQADYNKALETLQKAEEDKSKYKSRTQRLALWTSLVIGTAISAVGVRSLEPLMLPDTLSSISAFQLGAFRVVDVLLTGGLLAGGSEGVHKITQVFTEYFEKTRAKIKHDNQ